MPKPETNPDGSTNWGNVAFNENERKAHEAHTPVPSPTVSAPTVNTDGSVLAPPTGYNANDYLPFDKWVVTQPAANQAFLASQGPDFAAQFGYKGNLSPQGMWGSTQGGAGTGVGGTPTSAGFSPNGPAASGGMSAYERLLADNAANAAANQAAQLA